MRTRRVLQSGNDAAASGISTGALPNPSSNSKGMRLVKLIYSTLVKSSTATAVKITMNSQTPVAGTVIHRFGMGTVGGTPFNLVLDFGDVGFPLAIGQSIVAQQVLATDANAAADSTFQQITAIYDEYA